ncbi:hypothetical protein ACVDG8_011765 [Mesorhizobium sp. ORM8.1]
MSRLNAAFVTVIALLALALSLLGALKRHLDTAEDPQRPEEQRPIAVDLRIRIPQPRDALLNDPGAPIAGNPFGDAGMVSFFDYNCGVCRAAALDLQQALRNDPNVKLQGTPSPGAIFQIRRRRSARLAHCGSGVHDALPDSFLAGDGPRERQTPEVTSHAPA